MSFSRFVVLLLATAGFVGADDSRPARRPLFRDFMGINGHTIQFKPDLYYPTTRVVRDYHPVEWDLGDDTASVPPFPFARNRVSWREVYGSWHRKGYRTDVSLMFESIARDKWKDLAADTRAYGEHFARAFGPAGTNAFIESVEIGNEPGKFSDPDYRTVFENMARGLRAGDPRLKIATCALVTGKSHDYAKSVTCLTNLTELYDILNVHSYAQLENWPTWKRSFPEDPRLKEYLPDITNLCDWRDRNAPGKEVWLTEFGYDSTTKKPEPKGDFKDWVGVTDQQQAQWIVRSWLTFATLPVQRAYLYFFNDDDEPKLHAGAGLTRKFQPKPSYHAVAQLQRTLGDFRFHRTVLSRSGEATIQEYTHETDAKRLVWVAWSPTGENRTNTFTLPDTKAVVEKVERMLLCDCDDPSASKDVNGREIVVTESPLYLHLRLP
jgi:hypothetical protein